MRPNVSDVVAFILEVDPTSLRDDMGPGSIEAWDSVQHIVLMNALESTYGVTIDQPTIARLTSLGRSAVSSTMPDADLFGHPLSRLQLEALATASGQDPDQFDPALIDGNDLVLVSLMNLAPCPGQPPSPFIAFRAGETDTLDLVFSFAYTPIGQFSFREVYENSPNFALFLNTRDADFYQDGIPGVTRSIAETVTWLAAIRAHVGFRRVRAIGMSMGGYAALLFGDLLDVDDIYAFSPAIDGRFVFIGQQRNFADMTARLAHLRARGFISFGAHELSDFVALRQCLAAGLSLDDIHLVGNGHGGVPSFRLGALIGSSGRVSGEALVANPHPTRLRQDDVATLATAMLAVNAGESEQVIAGLEDVLRRDPYNPGLLYRLGVHRALAGRPHAARLAFVARARVYAALIALCGDRFSVEASSRKKLTRDYAHLLSFDRMRDVARLMEADTAPEPVPEQDLAAPLAPALTRRLPFLITTVTRDDLVFLWRAFPGAAALASACDVLGALRAGFGEILARDNDCQRLGKAVARAVMAADGVRLENVATADAVLAVRTLREANPPCARDRPEPGIGAGLGADDPALAELLRDQPFIGILAPDDDGASVATWAGKLAPAARVTWTRTPRPDAPSDWEHSVAWSIDTAGQLAETLTIPFPGAVFLLVAGVLGKIVAPTLLRRGAIVIDLHAWPAPCPDPPPPPPRLGSDDRAALAAAAIALAGRRSGSDGIEAARRILDDAARLCPYSVVVGIERLRLQLATGTFTEARRCADTIAAGQPDPAWFLVRAASLFMLAGRRDDACALLRRAFQERSLRPRTLVAYAEALADADCPHDRDADDLELVRNCLDQVMNVSDDPRLPRAAARLLHARGDRAGAIAALERAAALAGFDHATYLELARCRLGAGDRLGARAAAIMAACLEPGAPGALNLFQSAE